MNILIFGKNGQVGKALQREFTDAVALDRSQCDLTSSEAILATLTHHKPDVILNAAAYTAVDMAEDDAVAAEVINTKAVEAMANWAAENGALLVHYSTDYVFDGSMDSAYTEADIPAPLSVYGRTKLAGEKVIQNSGCKHLIFRTSWVYDQDGKNFPNTIMRLAAERDALTIINDQHGVPTHATLIAQVTKQCVEHFTPENAGIYNFVPQGETTWHGIARHLVRHSHIPLKCTVDDVKPITTSEYPTKATRPHNSRLDTTKLQKAFGLTLPSWTEHLDTFIKNYSN
ncbi:MAG: dTDP-4-dehydrorhamnose reductase [Thalassospira sp.]|nr:dTDP-4-dehydrorhamnose reductase [Thalassospira sp.]